MTTKADGSVTYWLDVLKNPVGPGAVDAASTALWERYYARMVRLARARLGRAASGGEEDVALSAFYNFCRSAADGRFPLLDDRDGLWRLLMTITTRKALNQIRKGHSHPVTDANLPLDLFAGREPTPEFAAIVEDEFLAHMAALGSDVERAVAALKLDGHTNQEVAVALGMGLRSVERKLKIIRQTWSMSLRTSGGEPSHQAPRPAPAPAADDTMLWTSKTSH